MMTKINEIVTINFVYKKVMITIKIYLFTRHTHTSLNFVSVDTMETLSVKCGKIMAFLLTQQPEKMTWIVAFLPISLQLCILIHFSSQQMIQYLKCWPRLYLLEKKCTDQEFQLFLIEFKNFDTFLSRFYRFYCDELKFDFKFGLKRLIKS